MEAAHADLPARDFVRPPGIVEHEICADSGARPTEYCTRREKELFAQDQPPLDEEQDWYQMVQVDAITGLRANEFCPDHVAEQLMVVITDERGREWAQAHPEYFAGLTLAPLETCSEGTERPQAFITAPAPGSTVHGVVPVIGTIQLPEFDRYEAQYGIGGNPQGWGWISGPHKAQVRDGTLTEWDTSHLSPGLYTLRITAFDRQQHRVEARLQVYVAAPTETPTPVQPPTPTAEPTLPPTLTPAPSPTSSPTPIPTVEPTATTVVTDTPELPTSEPSATPGAVSPGDVTPSSTPAEP
jgi:hypothetical protein